MKTALFASAAIFAATMLASPASAGIAPAFRQMEDIYFHCEANISADLTLDIAVRTAEGRVYWRENGGSYKADIIQGIASEGAEDEYGIWNRNLFQFYYVGWVGGYVSVGPRRTYVGLTNHDGKSLSYSCLRSSEDPQIGPDTAREVRPRSEHPNDGRRDPSPATPVAPAVKSAHVTDDDWDRWSGGKNVPRPVQAVRLLGYACVTMDGALTAGELPGHKRLSCDHGAHVYDLAKEKDHWRYSSTVE